MSKIKLSAGHDLKAITAKLVNLLGFTQNLSLISKSLTFK